MKKVLQLVLMLFVCELAHAQYYYLPFQFAGQNPGNLNHDSETVTATSLLTTWDTVLGPNNSSPTWSSIQNLPFGFALNGLFYSQFIVSSSGVLTFDIATTLQAPSYIKDALPNASIPDNSICLWGMAGKGNNDIIYTKTFGTSPNRQFWIQFNSYGYNDEFSDASNSTYWSIVLEETTNSIYLVDMRTIGYPFTADVSAGIQVDASTAYSVLSSPNLFTLAGTNSTAIDNSYYQFIYGTQPNFDLEFKTITTSSYLLPGNNLITGELRNLGTDTINSFKLNYTIDGGAIVSDSIVGVTIDPLNFYSFSHSIPWVSTTPGAYVLRCFTSEINGAHADQNASNDSSTKTEYILLAPVQRKPLYEIFTSSTCPPCKPGNLNFHSIVDTINQDNFVSIKYQQDFPGSGDPYTTIEGWNRCRKFYNINSIPRMENDGGWDENANSFTYPLYKSTRKVPAQYELSGRFSADTLSKTFSVKVYYSPLFAATGTVLQTAIVEKKTSLNLKNNGETAFYHVMKKMLPDENGTILTDIPAGANDSISITYTFNGNYRLPINGQSANIINNATENSVEQFGDLTMLGWLQSPLKDKQVYQAANYMKDTYIGIYAMNKSVNSIDIYPNPAKDFIAVDIALNTNQKLNIRLLDVNGQTLHTEQLEGNNGTNSMRFDMSKYAAGIYHLAVSDSKGNAFVRRISVTH